MTIDPHTSFFGHLVFAQMSLEEINDYVMIVDNFIKKADKRILEGKGGWLLNDDEFYQYIEPFPVLLHSSLVITVGIWLEGELKTFCHLLKRHLGLWLDLSDLKGSTIDRFRKYCEKFARIDIDVEPRQWEDIRGVWEIRNCLVHNDGFLDNFNKSAIIKIFSRRHKMPKVLKDRIEPSSESSILIVKIVSSFIERVYRSALKRFPDRGTTDEI